VAENIRVATECFTALLQWPEVVGARDEFHGPLDWQGPFGSFAQTSRII
jgi:hypothetical protein